MEARSARPIPAADFVQEPKGSCRRSR